MSYRKAKLYEPVIDLLKRYVHVEDGDESRTIRAKVTKHILTLDKSLQEMVPAVLFLLDALPEDSPFLQLDPPQRRQRTLDGLKRILLRQSQVQPLLLVFEDLHWIDSETQALLDSLVESLPTAQFLLLVIYRPEYTHGWGSKIYYTQLRLDPLPPESSDEILATLLGNDVTLEPLKTLLIKRTEGNPFFLEESVRTLVETQVLVGAPGAYCLAHQLSSIQIPPTVQAVLAARIDRLSQNAKSLLQTAAVIGNEVPFTLLQAIAQTPDEALHPCLTHLQAAEFLYETRLFPERVYTFRHALTHEVAYGSLLQERRRTLHAHIVAALETRASDQVDRLAYHAMRGEVWDKALTYCRQAGTKAYNASAFRETARCWEQALEALAHLPPDRNTREQSVDVRCDLYHALHPLLPATQYAQILTHLRAAESLAEGLADQRRLGSVYRRLGNTLRIMQDYEAARVYGQRVHATGIALGDVELQLEGNHAMGVLYYNLGGYRQAMEYDQQVLAAIQGAPHSQPFGVVPRLRGNLPIVVRTCMVQCLSELGAFADGVAYGTEALQFAEAADYSYDYLHVYHAVGYLHVRQGTLHQAISMLERGVALSQDADMALFFNRAAPPLALAYALAGRATDALPLLGQSEGNLVVRGEAYLFAGEVEEADWLVQRGLAHARDRKMRGEEARARWLFGEIAMHCNPPDIDQAKTHYQQALALATELGMRPLQAHCHRGLGTLYGQTGQPEQARAELSTAIEMYRDMKMTFWLPET